MSNKKELNDNLEISLAYEKLFMPEFFSIENNYTLDKAFAISNEKLDEVFKHIDLKGKSVLTVGSSGDQALNCILNGSKDITIIDANIFARPFIEYKIAAIKTFDYDTFSDVFIKNDFFSWKVYSKISHLLSKNVQMFWDTLILDINEDSYSYEFSAKTIKEKMLFVDHRDRHSLFYTSKSIYNKLQSALNNEDINISFVTSLLQDFPKALNKKYDLIYLSNIYDYYKGEESEQFETTIDKLYKKHLKDNGIIIANYSFNKSIKDAPKQLGKHMLEHKEVTRFFEGEKNKDTICFIKKKSKINKQYKKS